MGDWIWDNISSKILKITAEMTGHEAACCTRPVQIPVDISGVNLCVWQLNNRLFEELAMDVYDEVDRRENDAGEPYLIPQPLLTCFVLCKVENIYLHFDFLPIWKLDV